MKSGFDQCFVLSKQETKPVVLLGQLLLKTEVNPKISKVISQIGTGMTALTEEGEETG